MRKIFILLLVACGVLSVNAKVRYQGDASVGFGFGTGTSGLNHVMVNTVHGVRICPYFFVGAGVGADFATSKLKYSDMEFENIFVIPLYLNLKGYYPINQKYSVFVSGNIGIGTYSSDESMIFTDPENGTKSIYNNKLKGGLCFSPEVGFQIKLNHKFSVDFKVGYYAQYFKYEYSVKENSNKVESDYSDFSSGTIALKVGLVW